MHAAFQPTNDQRRQVRAMIGLGLRQEDVALVIGIDAKTLRLHFRRELDVAAIEANSRIAQSLFNQGINGNVTAAIFWLKVRAGWSEKHAVELSGPGAGPVAVTFRWSDVRASGESIELAPDDGG